MYMYEDVRKWENDLKRWLRLWKMELSTSETSGACIRNAGKGPKTDCPSHWMDPQKPLQGWEWLHNSSGEELRVSGSLRASLLSPGIHWDKKQQTVSCRLQSPRNSILRKKFFTRLPWWLRDKEPTYQCRRQGFNPWFGKVPSASEQLSPWATIEHNYWACALEPGSRNYWAHKTQILKPAHPRAHALQREDTAMRSLSTATTE